MNDLELYAKWLSGFEHKAEERIREVAKRVERRRARLEDGIAALVKDLKSDCDVMLPTLTHDAAQSQVYAAVCNVMQRLADIVTAQETE